MVHASAAVAPDGALAAAEEVTAVETGVTEMAELIVGMGVAVPMYCCVRIAT